MIESVRHAIRDVLAGNAANLSAKEIALRIGKALSTVYSWGEFGESGRDPSIADIKQVVLVTGDHRPIDALCRECGGMFLPLPPERGGALDSALIKAVTEFGESVAEVGKDWEDGKLDDKELRRIRREIGEAMSALAALRAAAESEAKRRENER